MAHLSQLMNQYQYNIINKSLFYSDFLTFLPNVHFFSRIPLKILHYVWSLCLVRLLLALTVSQMFLILMTLRVLRSSGQKFCKMHLSWDLLMFSSKLAWDYRFGEKVHRSVLLIISYHIRGPCYQNDISVDVNLDHLTEVVSVRFLHCKVILFLPLPILYS